MLKVTILMLQSVLFKITYPSSSNMISTKINPPFLLPYKWLMVSNFDIIKKGLWKMFLLKGKQGVASLSCLVEQGNLWLLLKLFKG